MDESFQPPKNMSTPWFEKYRPTEMEQIVLSEHNRIMFQQMIDTHQFPNVLLYGPPGTGKTTTIVNIISAFQKARGWNPMGSTIHLNASDERGIDIVRNQLYPFVKTQSMFQEKEWKFVVLDEVDHMTKTAQNALKYLVQTCASSVRFCLMCNYVSKIDGALLDEFMMVRFNQLPETEVRRFLQSIVDKESVALSTDDIRVVQQQFDSDIRSMINYVQVNQTTHRLPTHELHEALHGLLLKPDCLVQDVSSWIHEQSIRMNMDALQVLLLFFQWAIENMPPEPLEGAVAIMEKVVHCPCPWIRLHYLLDHWKHIM